MNKKNIKKFEGCRWRCVMKYKGKSKTIIAKAVIGYNEGVLVENVGDSREKTNNINNSQGKRVDEWVVQRSLMMSGNDGPLGVQCRDFRHAGYCTKEYSKEERPPSREVSTCRIWHIEEDRAHNQTLRGEVEEHDSCR